MPASLTPSRMVGLRPQPVKGGLRPSPGDACGALDWLLTKALEPAKGSSSRSTVGDQSQSTFGFSQAGRWDGSLGESGIQKEGPRPNYVIGPISLQVRAHAVRPRQLQAVGAAAMGFPEFAYIRRNSRRRPPPHPATYPSARPAPLPIHPLTVGRFISVSRSVGWSARPLVFRIEGRLRRERQGIRSHPAQSLLYQRRNG